MKNRLYLFVSLILTVCLMAWSCFQAEQDVPVEDIVLSQYDAEMVVGDILVLEATIYPEDATDKTIAWSSSVPTVATVNENGKVTAVGSGKTVILAKAGTLMAPCTIVVSPAKVDISEIKLDKSSLSMTIGDEQTLVATIVPADATVQTLLWASSNTSVATVENGKVVAVKEGTATISASGDGKTAECSVTVDYIHVQSITLDKTEVTLTEGESYTLTATVKPDDATYPTLAWTSSDTSIATVSDAGTVTSVAPGNVRIKASADGQEAECVFTVQKAPDPVPTSTGIYIAGQAAYEFNPKEQQISIYSAEGNSWYRFLFPASLMMYQVGPIPASVAVGDTVNVVLETFTSGVETAQPVNYTLEIQSMDGVTMVLSSAAGDVFILRY
jgi:uncharacterized protein YjdB